MGWSIVTLPSEPNPACDSISTTCPYCGVGCGVDAAVPRADQHGNQCVQSVAGTPDHPANFGRLCVKGSALHEAVGPANRLLHPLVHGQRVSWDSALDTVATGLRRIIDTHGPDAVAFYLSGQLLTEDYYVANKLMKGFIGSANVDTNSRLCMSSAVASYKRAFGADAVPCCYEDLEHCNLIVLTGSNMAWTHPILFQRLSAAKARNPALRVVVIDPRRTATCDLADLFLPLRPGSDAFLFNGLLHYLHTAGHLAETWLAAHCEGLDAALAACADCTIEAVSAQTKLPAEQLQQFYALFAATEAVVSFYSQGINQSSTGTDKGNAIINCHLATARIGRPGMGPFSITGQPNAMGGREVGGLANMLAAHMDFSPEHQRIVADFWHTQALAQQPGLKAVDLFRAIGDGRIKAVWIMGTNPVVSLPDSEQVRRALHACELVVVSDCVQRTETNACAHVLLPATGWGEKDGTVTNSERCISRQRALLLPRGEAKPDWQIVSAVAQRLGYGAAFAYQCPHDIFVEHAALSGFRNGGSRAFDISGLQHITAREYERLQPIQWPVNAAAPHGTPRLFGDGRFYTANGKARLLPISAVLPPVHTSHARPYLLNTGRLRDQWHTMTRTGEIPRLLQHHPAPFAALHPDTAAALGCAEDELLAIGTARGTLLLPAKHDSGQQPGAVFVPIHWNAQFASNARVSKLLEARVDPHSGQPESKLEAVSLAVMPQAQWLAIVSDRELSMADYSYWHRRPIRGGHCYQAASTRTLDNAALAALKALFPGSEAVEFHDIGQHEYRLLFIRDGRLCGAVFAAPRPAGLPAADWLQRLLTEALPEQPWLLLAGRPLDGNTKGPLVCSCFEVGKNDILAAIRAGARDHVALGNKLRCGTNCGSCVPELKQLLRQAVATAPPVAALHD